MRLDQDALGLGLTMIVLALGPSACVLEPNPNYRGDMTPVRDMEKMPDLQPVCLPVTDTAGVGELLIPCGSFMLGSMKNDPLDPGVDSSEMPETMELVQGFYLDKTEVTALAYQGCVEGGKCTAPVGTGNYCTYGQNNYPINCVNWTQASAYCAAQGKRLPTEIEWEYAARGAMHSTYPWGNGAPIPPGTDMGLPQACWDLSNGTCQVSQFPATLFGQPNPNGLSDMAGNVYEWTSSEYVGYPTSKTCTDNCVIRGGSWDFYLPDHLRAAFRYSYAPSLWYGDIGMRCARTAAH